MLAKVAEPDRVGVRLAGRRMVAPPNTPTLSPDPDVALVPAPVPNAFEPVGPVAPLYQVMAVLEVLPTSKTPALGKTVALPTWPLRLVSADTLTEPEAVATTSDPTWATLIKMAALEETGSNAKRAEAATDRRRVIRRFFFI